MKRVAVFLAEGFEEMEAVAPLDLLRRAGAQCQLVSLQGRLVTGTQGITLAADCSMNELSGSYDLLVLPGGMPGAATLTGCEPLLSLLREQDARGGLIGAICAAPLVLAKAGLLAGRRVTTYPGYERRLRMSGAVVTGAAVERDGNLITARSGGVAMGFGCALVEALGFDVTALHRILRDEP